MPIGFGFGGVKILGSGSAASPRPMMKNAGITPAIVQEFIAHDSPEISANYTNIEMDAMREAAESMPDIQAQ
jgi:hypothetical protein